MLEKFAQKYAHLEVRENPAKQKKIDFLY